MAFNGQGQWKQEEWESFKAWTTSQLGSKDQRLHLLRFKSAVARRRLARLLAKTPPVIDDNVKAASLAFKDDAFQGAWEPETYNGHSLPLAPTFSPQARTGAETKGIKDLFTRELRITEYYEHLIQKTRFEIQKIEDEIYWLECADKKVAAHQDAIDKQFLDPEFRENLIATDNSFVRHELTDPIDPLIMYTHFSGEDQAHASDSDPSLPYQPTQYDSEYYKNEESR